MGVATGTNSRLRDERAIAKVALAAVAISGGLLVGAAVGLGLGTNLLLAGVVAPFALLATFLWPGWAAPVYIVLVYADLLSILVRYHGMPPLARFAGFVILVAVVGRRLVKREGLVNDPMTAWLVVYGIVLSLGLFYAQAPDLVATEMIEFLRNFITYIVAINALVSLKRVHIALWALLAMGTLLAFLTVYQTVTGNFDSDFGGLAQSKVSGITEVSDAPRPAGTLGDANYYGQGLLILVPVAFYFASRAKQRPARAAGLLAALVLIAAVIFTYSRGDTLALASILVLAAIYKRPPPQFIFGGLIAVGMMIAFLPSTYYERLGTLLNVLSGGQQAIASESSLLGRAGAASAAISMFADYPILGVGRSNYPLHELDYIEGTNLASKSSGIPPHDLYLEVAAEQGVVGILVMGGILFTTLSTLAKTRRSFLSAGDSAHAELAVWLGITLAGYLVSSLFLHGAFLYMLWLQVALVVALYHVARSAEIATNVRKTAGIGRAIRVREERPPGPAQVLDKIAGALPPASETPRAGAGRLILGIMVTLAAGGLLGLGALYAMPRQSKDAELQSSGPVLPAAQPAATPGAVTAPLAGYEVSGLFLAFWQSHGGPEVFGYPVAPELLESTPDGRLLRVQYFERARLEYHPEISDPAQQVEVGRLGSEVPKAGKATAELPQGLQGAPVVLAGGKPGVPPLFATFWKRFGEPVFGYPISPVMVETRPGGGQLFTQYFERARLEYHPESAGGEVAISNLGVQVYRSKYGSK